MTNEGIFVRLYSPIPNPRMEAVGALKEGNLGLGEQQEEEGKEVGEGEGEELGCSRGCGSTNRGRPEAERENPISSEKKSESGYQRTIKGPVSHSERQ